MYSVSDSPPHSVRHRAFVAAAASRTDFDRSSVDATTLDRRLKECCPVEFQTLVDRLAQMFGFGFGFGY